MSGYKDLYDYCQTLSIKVSRKFILRKILEITDIGQIKSVKTCLDVNASRGMFLSATNTNHRIVEQLGCNVILLARDQNYCWERFVNTKELMHVFDSNEQVADLPEKLERILTSFQVSSTGDQVIISEHIGFWRALACLCPEKYRLQFKEELDNNLTDYYSIALKLRIPEQIVPQLFIDNYEEIIAHIQ